MPYIKQVERERFDKHIEGLLNEKFDKHIEGLLDALCNEETEFQPGQLNYIVSKLIKKIIEEGSISCILLDCITFELIKGIVERHGISYTLCNGIIGALECVIHEFSRRNIKVIDNRSMEYNLCNDIKSVIQEFYKKIVVPYEDKKIIENGDI